MLNNKDIDSLMRKFIAEELMDEELISEELINLIKSESHETEDEGINLFENIKELENISKLAYASKLLENLRDVYKLVEEISDLRQEIFTSLESEPSEIKDINMALIKNIDKLVGELKLHDK